MLDPLPPDIRFEPLLPNPEDMAFSFAAKKEALGPHVRVRWPWDEVYQSQIHRQRFSEKPFFKIRRRDDPVGVLSWQVHEDHARFGEFYLFEKYQRAGLGTRILRHTLRLADKNNLPVRLEYLQWNPVGALYLRHGFIPIGTSDIHVFLERPPNRSPA